MEVDKNAAFLGLPKVSIMMICHTGRGKTLIRAVHSVLRQTYPNWELVIQDDHSTDLTYEIATLLACKDKRIKVYRNEVNLGPAKNRAVAVKNMTGDLFCHVDSDDFIYPHALTTMVEAFLRNPAIGFAFSDTAYALEDNVIYAYAAHKGPGGPLFNYGWRHLGMYTRAAYEQTKGYNESLSFCEDRDLFMQIAEKFPFARVDQALYVYNMSGDRASNTVPLCEKCPSRGNCNYIRGWVSALIDPEHKTVWQKRIEEVQNNG